MKQFTHFLTTLIVSAWIGAIAIFSIQNITLVSLKILFWESIKLPIGVLLAFCVGLGMILGSMLPLLLRGSSKRQE